MFQWISSIFFWSASGAGLLVGLSLFERYVNGLPTQTSHLILSAALGALAGILFGRSDLRLRSLTGRLEDSEKRFSRLYQKTPAMLHSMDEDGRLIYVSQSWLDNFGYTRNDVIGRNFFDFVIDENVIDRQRKHLRALKETGEVKDLRYLFRGQGGREIEIAVSETVQKDSSGNVIESLAVVANLGQSQTHEERIEKLAYYDSLTGLPNRVLLHDRMLQSIALARRDERKLGVFFFDLDRFKTINDTQGHAVGDLVLRSVAQRLRKFIREGDTFSRLGGDEFVIVQADPNHDPNFAILARRILETLREAFQLGDREFYTTASIGVAVFPDDGDDPHTLLKSADTAMYVAKSRGRNNFQFFSGEMNAEAVARADLETRLRKALENDELSQHYQPLIDLDTGEITGVEALMRWSDEDGQAVSPARIISVAEDCGLVYSLGEWSLHSACNQAQRWQDENLPPIRMSVNLSGHHIRQANFIDRLEGALSRSGLKPQHLEIELTENSVMGHVNEIIMALTDLKVRGINLAIDDFGTGSSSLLLLKHFPIHRIKIAQEFIRDIVDNPDYASITEAIIAMAKSLNLSVSAVGVETQAQLAFLKKHHCTEAQGRIFKPALSGEEVADLLRAQSNFRHLTKTDAPIDLASRNGPKLVH